MMRAVLGRRDFTLVWLAGLISLTGDRAMMIALPVFVYLQTGSTLATAGMFAAFYLPSVLLGSVAGVFADRWNRKRIMIVTNLLQGLVILLLLLAHSRDALWLVYLVTFVETCLAMFFQPAEGALLPTLVADEQLPQANALTGLSNNVARLAGPPLGGLLVGLLGLQSVAVVDSVSFVIAAGLIAWISAPKSPAANREDGAVVSAWTRTWLEWREGLQVVVRNRAIAVLFLIVNITSLGGTMIDPLYEPFVLSILHAGATAVGFVSTATAIGGILGGLLLAQFGAGTRPAVLVFVGNTVGGLCLLLLYHQTTLPPALVYGFLLGMPLVGTNVGLETYAQTSTPDRYRGRVWGAIGTTNALVGLFSLAVAGALGQVIGVVPMLTVAASITIFAGVLAVVAIPWAERATGLKES